MPKIRYEIKNFNPKTMATINQAEAQRLVDLQLCKQRYDDDEMAKTIDASRPYPHRPKDQRVIMSSAPTPVITTFKKIAKQGI